MDKIRHICLSRLHELTSGIQSKDDIIIFDNFEKPNDLIGTLPQPVKFDFNLSIFLMEGSITLRIGHEEFVLRPYEWITIMTGKIFQTIKISDNAKIGICCINDGFYNINPDIIIDLYNRFIENPVISLSKENAMEYLDSFMHLKKYIGDKDHTCRTELLRSYCNVIFLILCSEIQKNNDIQKHRITRKDTIYEAFLSNIKKYYKKERSVKFYADKLCLTPKYLSTVIHQVTGRHASEWIDSHTILEIKALLRTTNTPVQQIAYELNFSTPAHFGKFFKRLTGLSPQKYRHTV
jgi:AraC-like DNA-binding protein